MTIEEAKKNQTVLNKKLEELDALLLTLDRKLTNLENLEFPPRKIEVDINDVLNQLGIATPYVV